MVKVQKISAKVRKVIELTEQLSPDDYAKFRTGINLLTQPNRRMSFEEVLEEVERIHKKSKLSSKKNALLRCLCDFEENRPYPAPLSSPN